ncbi:MAG: hypothetical protein ACOZQL_13630 [Myxococcota bacterium]
MKREGLLFGATIVGSVVVAWWASRHEAPLLIGTTPQAQLVPWWYQVTAFPPFFLLGGGLWLEWSRARAALLGVSSLVALSGHAVFLSACVVFTLVERRFVAARAVLATSAAGLLITAWSKVRWGDERWFAASVLVGSALALALLRGSSRSGSSRTR